MTIPKEILREHIEKAILEITPDTIPPKRREQFYSLEEGNKSLPPKYVISIANKFANGIVLDSKSFNAVKAKEYLTKLNFNVIDSRIVQNISQNNIWIEETKIHGRKDRLEGERALGKVLWSPQKGKLV